MILGVKLSTSLVSIMINSFGAGSVSSVPKGDLVRTRAPRSGDGAEMQLAETGVCVSDS